MNPPKGNMAKQQVAFEVFNYDLNYERPHEALRQKSPASVYHASDRAYPKRIPAIEYDGDVLVKNVRHSGELYWKGSNSVNHVPGSFCQLCFRLHSDRR